MTIGYVDLNQLSFKEKFIRVFTVLTQALEVYVFGGLIFGFGNLVYILKKERILSKKFFYRLSGNYF